MITRSVWIPSLSANSLSALFEDSPSFKRFLVGPCSHPSASALSPSGARSFDPFASSSPPFVPPNADTATVVVDVVTVLATALFDGTLELASNSEYVVPPRTSNGKSRRVSVHLADARRSLLPWTSLDKRSKVRALASQFSCDSNVVPQTSLLEEDSTPPLERNSRSKLFNGCAPTTIELPPSPNAIGSTRDNVSRQGGSRCSLLSCSVLETAAFPASNCPTHSKRRGDNSPVPIPGLVPNLTDPRPPLAAGVSAPAMPSSPDLSMRRTAGGEAPSA